MPSKKAKAAAVNTASTFATAVSAASTVGATGIKMQEQDLREPNRILGTILSGLEMFDRQSLEAVAPEMLALAGKSAGLTVDSLTEEELRKRLRNVARDIFKRHPTSLKRADDLIASIQLASLERD